MFTFTMIRAVARKVIASAPKGKMPNVAKNAVKRTAAAPRKLTIPSSNTNKKVVQKKNAPVKPKTLPVKKPSPAKPTKTKKPVPAKQKQPAKKSSNNRSKQVTFKKNPAKKAVSVKTSKTTKKAVKKPSSTAVAVRPLTFESEKRTAKQTHNTTKGSIIKASTNANIDIVTACVPLLSATAGIPSHLPPTVVVEAAQEEPKALLPVADAPLLLPTSPTMTKPEGMMQTNNAATPTPVAANTNIDSIFSEEGKAAAELEASIEAAATTATSKTTTPPRFPHLRSEQKSRLLATKTQRPASFEVSAMPKAAQTMALRGLNMPVSAPSVSTAAESQTEQ